MQVRLRILRYDPERDPKPHWEEYTVESEPTAPLLDLVPDALPQRVPVIMGSADEVERIVGYHADACENVSWQLFKTRSLFIQPNA